MRQEELLADLDALIGRARYHLCRLAPRGELVAQALERAKAEVNQVLHEELEVLLECRSVFGD